MKETCVEFEGVAESENGVDDDVTTARSLCDGVSERDECIGVLVLETSLL